jgi:PIN domain nuclease of toxin-antitoxin system
MKILLDTHVLLWWAFGEKPLSKKLEKLLEDPTSQVFVSAAAFWEIAIKVQRNKLEIRLSPEALLDQVQSQTRAQILKMTAEHAVVAGGLTGHHYDPFDRMMIAQCMVERLHLATDDTDTRKYPVQVVW